MVVEANVEVHPLDIFLIEGLSEIKTPVFLAINKIDLIEKQLLLPLH